MENDGRRVEEELQFGSIERVVCGGNGKEWRVCFWIFQSCDRGHRGQKTMQVLSWNFFLSMSTGSGVRRQVWGGAGKNGLQKTKF